MSTRHYVKKFQYALIGLGYALRRETSFQLQVAAGVLVIAAAAVRHLPPVRWAVVLIAISSVLAAEIFNTVLERLLDLTEPRLSPHVALLKDLLAAAVLIVSLAAAAAVVLAFI